jgi:Xaa-Pro aminopeptidase
MRCPNGRRIFLGRGRASWKGRVFGSRHGVGGWYAFQVDHIRRIGALRRKLARAGLSGLVVTHLPDLRYISGFTGSSAALAVTRRSARLFTDGRYTSQAAEEVKAAQVEIVSGPPAVAAVQWLAAQPGVEVAAYDPGRTTVAELSRWKAGLPVRMRRAFLLAMPMALVESLRMVKDEDELALMFEAAHLGCRLFDHILGFVKPGLREVEVAAELEHKARLFGAEAMSFETIVASGVRSSLPHGRATDALLPRRGFLTLDFGIILGGYCSDMTRTVFFGKPKAEERNTYQAVLEAQESGVAAVRAGASCGEVDEAARSVLRREGLAEAFSHSTGHGVGLEIHEQPRVGAGQNARLMSGMVITIEPGVYLAGRYGIRIEDMVVVTPTGGQVLTPAPKALIEL